MPDIDDLDAPDIPLDDPRLDAEWTALSAFREMLGIALKGKESPTYAQSFHLAQSIIPEIFGSGSLLAHAAEPEDVRMYRQKAEAQSLLTGVPVTALEIVNKEIVEYETLLAVEPSNVLLEKPLSKLRRIRFKLTKLDYSENQIIIRDAFQANHLPVPSFMSDSYRDYRISETRGLRIRLLHPDKPEHSTGADLIYEQYWGDKGVARLTAIQYKIWNGERLYFSKAKNLKDQLGRLKKTFCDGGLCDPSNKSKRRDSYRLPYCSAFLRPTDRLQDQNSQLVSTGLHVPVCVVNRLCGGENEAKKIERKLLRGESLSQVGFAELFNYNMCGSKWLTFKELKHFYEAHSILRNRDTISIHAQEFDVPQKEDFPTPKGRRHRGRRSK
jgi:hypothetical protein